MKRVEYAENDPATGNRTDISPKAWTVQYSIIPTIRKDMSTDAGPAFESALPEPIKRPVPIHIRQLFSSSPAPENHLSQLYKGYAPPTDPPIAIICKCLPLSLRCSREEDVAVVAATISYSYRDPPAGVE